MNSFPDRQQNRAILDLAVTSIQQDHGIEIVLNELPQDDAKAFTLLQSGKTHGIFQLESAGIRDLLTRLKPERLDHIVAIPALYRPEPLQFGMVMTYVNVKNGQWPGPAIHPIVVSILAETYGVLLYQEQCERILKCIGGIEHCETNQCLEAIRHQQQDVVTRYFEKFVAGAQSRGISQSEAEKIWKFLERFAPHSWNRSDATDAATMTYQATYLKAHHRAEFMAALLTCGMDSSRQTFQSITECRRMGIEVLPPDVNLSETEFRVIPAPQPDSNLAKSAFDRQISFGLGAIKGMREVAIRVIVEERNSRGPFQDLVDFRSRVNPQDQMKEVLRILLKAGAFDRFGLSRSQQMQAINGMDQTAVSPPSDLWSHGQIMAFEKEAFGFYLTSHPVTEFADQIKAITQLTTRDLHDAGDGEEVILGGMITKIKWATKKKPSRNGHSRYVKFVLEDAAGKICCLMRPDDCASESEKIRHDSIVMVTGRVDRRGLAPRLIVNRVRALTRPADDPHLSADSTAN